MLALCTLGPLPHALLFLLSFFLLLHVASFLAGVRLLILLLVLGAWPSLAPFPWADPISLRSQATPYPSVGHNMSQYCCHVLLKRNNEKKVI
jgi:hypothetical protein